MFPRADKLDSHDAIKVLHIDDEPDIIAITKESIAAFDSRIQLQPCTDPESALEELEASAYDCVVSDYQMGGFDSLALAETIHKRFDIPVLIYTGRGSEEVAEAAFEAGVDDYIRKEASSSHYQVLGKRIRAAVDKHRAERELRESEERFRSLFDSTHDGVIVSGPDGRYISANPAAAKILGYNSSEELLGLSAETFYARSEERKALYDKLTETGYITDYEHEIKRRDGSRGYVSANATIQRNAEGKIDRSEVFFRDITERKRYSDRLKAIHRHTLKLRNTRDAKEVSKNTLDGVEEIFGFQKTSFSLVDGKIIKPVEIRSDAPLARTEIPLDDVGLIAKVARTGESVLLSDVRNETDYFMARESTMSELTVPVKIGDEVVAVINIESSELDAFSSEDQRLVETFAEHVASAISLHEESSKLSLSEERYRTLIENALEGVWIIDAKANTTYVNPSMAEMLGYDKEELLGMHLFSFLDEKGVEEAKKNLNRRERGIEESLDVEFIRKDGERIFTLLSTSPIYDSEGNYQGSIAFVSDITERRKVEDALRVNQERLHAFMESAPVTLTIYDSDLNYVDVNQNLLDLYGYTRDFLIGRNMEDLHPDSAEAGRSKLYREVIRTGEPLFLPEVRSHEKLGENVYSIWAFKVGEGMGLISTDITDSKTVEKMLKESEARLRLFMDSATDGFSLLDSDLNIVDINEARVKMTPSTRESLVGKNIRDLYPFHKERLDQRVEVYEKILKTGESEKFDDVIRHPSFGERQVMVQGFKVGEGLGIITTDISEKKNLEKNLRESETLYRELAERSIDVIYKVDLEGRLQYLSPSVENLIGYTPEELIGKPYLSFLSVDQRPGVEIALVDALAGNHVQGFQAEMTAKDGKAVPIEVNSSLIVEKGKPTGFQGVIRDVTERKRMENELRESEERYRNLVELSPEVIMTFDFKGYVTSVNSAIERLTGFTPDEVVGRHFTKLGYLRVQDIPRYVRLLPTFLRGDFLPSMVFPYQHKDGTLKWAEGYGGFAYEKGKKVGFQGIVIDITERRRLGERLEALHAHAVELGAADSIETIAETTLNVLDLTLGFTIGAFCINTGSSIDMRYGRGVDPWEPFELPLAGKGVTVRAVKTRKTQRITDTRLEPDFVSRPERSLFEIRSEIDVPVVIDDEVVAVINANSTKPNAITE